MKRVSLITLSIIVISIVSYAQDNDSTSLADAVRSVFGIDQPKVGVLIQFGADVKDNGSQTESKFSTHLLRLILSGSVEEKFLYFVQGDLNGSYSLLDVKLSYRIDEHWKLSAGQFKSPFGREFLRNDANLTFVNRSTVARTLGTFRQRGVEMQCASADKRLTMSAGIFNGPPVTYDNRISLIVGRILAVPVRIAEGDHNAKFEVGVSAAYSSDRNDVEFYYPSPGDQFLYGSDARCEFDNLWVESEYIAYMANKEKWAEGIYLDGGIHLTRQWEIAGRIDWFKHYLSRYALSLDNIYGSTFHVGVNWFPLDHVKLQLDLERHYTHRYYAGILNLQYAINHLN